MDGWMLCIYKEMYLSYDCFSGKNNIGKNCNTLGVAVCKNIFVRNTLGLLQIRNYFPLCLGLPEFHTHAYTSTLAKLLD